MTLPALGPKAADQEALEGRMMYHKLDAAAVDQMVDPMMMATATAERNITLALRVLSLL